MTNKDAHSNLSSHDATPPSCFWKGCKELGKFRAPISKQNLRLFHWFCLEHIRIYNSKWNYCENMSEKNYEELIKSDVTWNRPTWPFTSDVKNAEFELKTNLKFEKISDPFNMFDIKKGTLNNYYDKVSYAEISAMRVLGLEFPVSKDEVKVRYKFLVKNYHPDRNGGDKKAEEKLKKIIEAYEIIMNMCVE